MKPIISLSCLCLAALLAGCASGSPDTGSGGGSTKGNGADKKPPVILLDAIGLEGTLSESASVDVNGVADQDGTVDADYVVEIPLGSNGLPPEPNGNNIATGSLVMQASDGAANVGAEQVDVDY